MRLFKKIKEKRRNQILQVVEKAHLFRRYIYLIIGVLIYALSYNIFFFNNNIVYGGVSGISIITKDIIDPSLLIMILNVFLMLLSLIFLGKKATLNSFIGSILFPIFVKLTANVGSNLDIDNSNLLLIAVVGGVCVGFAAGIVFKSGFTTGGTDILNQIVSKYFKVSIGTAVLMSDGIIAFIGGFFFGWTKVLYAFIVLYIINIMVDKVVLGISGNKAVYITTNNDDEVCEYLMYELKLGVTLIETRGGYTNRRDQIIMCVVPNNDYFKVKEGVEHLDSKATVLVTDAYQALGTYNGNNLGK